MSIVLKVLLTSLKYLIDIRFEKNYHYKNPVIGNINYLKSTSENLYNRQIPAKIWPNIAPDTEKGLE